MGVPEGQREALAAKFGVILPHLDERQRRLLIGAEARSLGHGGIRAVARAAGVREGTVSLGVRELESGQAPLGRSAGPEVTASGSSIWIRVFGPHYSPWSSPMSAAIPCRRCAGPPSPPASSRGNWPIRATESPADTVGDLLREEGFSLQSNAKTLEGRQHPDRDGQFHYLNEQAREHRDSGAPVITVDTKKKELVGPFKNNGHEWQPKGEPVRVDTHDFPDRELGKAVPYGIYDVAANTGWVNAGNDHDTASFAVESIRRWWNSAGRAAYPQPTGC